MLFDTTEVRLFWSETKGKPLFHKLTADEIAAIANSEKFLEWKKKQDVIAAAKQFPLVATAQQVAMCAVGIAEDFFGNRYAYDKFYDRLGEAFGGFPGIQELVVAAGTALAAREQQDPKLWETHDYPETTDNIAAALHALTEPPTPEQLKALIDKAIREAVIEIPEPEKKEPEACESCQTILSEEEVKECHCQSCGYDWGVQEII